MARDIRSGFIASSNVEPDFFQMGALSIYTIRDQLVEALHKNDQNPASCPQAANLQKPPDFAKTAFWS
jgi:hypothetical protein